MNCCFNASGDTFIFHEDISRIQSRVKEPKNKFHINRDVWIWEDSDKNGSYLISCLPEGEKVLTNSGLKNVKNIEPMDSLVDISGKEVTVKNKQITTNWIGKIYEFKLSNNFRSFKFTNNHPIWCSSAILKRNYLKNHNTYRFNERYWDLDFSFKKSEDVCVGDWIEFPNIYRNKILTSEQILSYWKPSDTRTDFKLNNNILLSKDFWWFIGMWLAEGWVINSYDNVYQIETAHNIKEKDIIFKMKNIINNLFDRQANLIEKKEDNCIKISFSSKELGIFLTSEFGKYAHGKKIPQWVKYLPDNLKMNLIEGYILGDGCWFSEERVNKNIVDLESKMSCVSVSLELLEGIQDILFSVGIMSCLGKLRDEKKTFIKKRESKQKITYSLSLSHYDSVDLANRLKWNHSYEIKNKRIIKDSFFSKDLSKIYFRVKKIIKKEYSGNVYNFETETHTYCTNRIVTHNCDVSRGDAKDYSAFHVFRMDTHPIRQVAEYKGKIKPDQLGLLLVSVGQVYNNATIATIF